MRTPEQAGISLQNTDAPALIHQTIIWQLHLKIQAIQSLTSALTNILGSFCAD
jgi:hypothetical protein